jgi:hypothetical protein
MRGYRRPGRNRAYAAAVLAALLNHLEAEYGVLEPAHPTGAVALLLWENVAYLVDDSRRAAAFGALEATVGVDPVAILAAPDAVLLAVVAGMRPGERVSRLRRVAELALARDLVQLAPSAPWPRAVPPFRAPVAPRARC